MCVSAECAGIECLGPATPANCGALWAERVAPDGGAEGEPVLLGHVNVPTRSKDESFYWPALETDHRWVRWNGTLYLLWKRLPELRRVLDDMDYLNSGAAVGLARVACEPL